MTPKHAQWARRFVVAAVTLAAEESGNHGDNCFKNLKDRSQVTSAVLKNLVLYTRSVNTDGLILDSGVWTN